MQKQIKYIFIIAVLVAIVFTLSTCKKYPENTLWFKNPKKLQPLKGYITKYNVNGIDSLHLMDSYFGNYSGSPYLIKDISKAEFRFSADTYDKAPQYNIVFPPFANLAVATITFKNHKKYVFIETRIDTSILKRNIFMDADWKIIRLTEKTGPFKIETTLTNGNKYEIQFN